MKEKLFTLIIASLFIMAISGCSSNGGSPLPLSSDLSTVKRASHRPHLSTESPVSKPDSGEKSPVSLLKQSEPSGHIGETGMPILQIMTADKLFIAGINPFLVKLPKPLKIPKVGEEDLKSAKPNEKPAQVDPLQQVHLIGIVYQSQMPIALLSVDSSSAGNGEKTGGNQATLFVKRGDTFTAEENRIRVASITPKTVTLAQTGSQTNQITLVLPDIIGFHDLDTGKSPDENADNPPSKRNLKKSGSNVLQEPKLPADVSN